MAKDYSKGSTNRKVLREHKSDPVEDRAMRMAGESAFAETMGRYPDINQANIKEALAYQQERMAYWVATYLSEDSGGRVSG